MKVSVFCWWFMRSGFGAVLFDLSSHIQRAAGEWILLNYRQLSRRYASPTITVTVPVPSQAGQSLSATRPLPWHLGQMFFPDCLDPGWVSSPGFGFFCIVP